MTTTPQNLAMTTIHTSTGLIPGCAGWQTCAPSTGLISGLVQLLNDCDDIRRNVPSLAPALDLCTMCMYSYKNIPVRVPPFVDGVRVVWDVNFFDYNKREDADLRGRGGLYTCACEPFML